MTLSCWAELIAKVSEFGEILKSVKAFTEILCCTDSPSKDAVTVVVPADNASTKPEFEILKIELSSIAQEIWEVISCVELSE